MSATSSALPQSTDYTDAGSELAPGVGTGSDAGAAGDSSQNSMSLSTGGLIAIIVVVVIVTIIGVSTATLFFIAKKREWKVREKLRQSARKVAAALTPRRSQFPDSVKKGAPPRRDGRPKRLASRETILRSSSEDVEKGLPHKEPSYKSRR